MKKKLFFTLSFFIVIFHLPVHAYDLGFEYVPSVGDILECYGNGSPFPGPFAEEVLSSPSYNDYLSSSYLEFTLIQERIDFGKPLCGAADYDIYLTWNGSYFRYSVWRYGYRLTDDEPTIIFSCEDELTIDAIASCGGEENIVSIDVENCTFTCYTSIPADCLQGNENDGTCTNKSPEMQGNPINILNGNKYESATDLIFPSPNQNKIKFNRFYNSQSTSSSTLGYGWTHQYSMNLSMLDLDNVSHIRIEDPTGRGRYFKAGPDNRLNGAFHEKSHIIAETDGTYTWYKTDGSQYGFSSQGQLIWFADRVGNRQILTYNATSGLLEILHDEAGNRTLSFSYYENNLLHTILGPVTESVPDSGNGFGIWATYEYDDIDNLTSVTYADGSGFTYVYNDPNELDPKHNLTEKKDKLNHQLATWSYNADDKGINSSTRDGKGVTINYVDAEMVEVTDAYGTSRTYTISTLNLLYPKITNITDPGGCTSCAGDMPIRYEYDTKLNIIEKEYANGTIHKFEDFDDFGNPRTVIPAFGTAAEKTITKTYHPKTGQMVSKSEKSVLGLETDKKVTIWDYDNDLDAEANELIAQYEEGDETVIIPVLVSRMVETGFTHDINCQVVPYENVTLYEYNTKGQIIGTDGPLPGDQDKTIFNFDATSGDLMSVSMPLGLTVSLSNYDAAGNPAMITDVNGNPRLYMYDARNRETLNWDYSINYTLAGEPQNVTDFDGVTISYSYENTYGRLDQIHDPAGNSIQYGYDNQGNQTSVQTYDSGNYRHSYMRYDYQSPDIPGKLWKIVNPDNSETVYSYDQVGNIESIQDAEGKTATYAYDLLGQVTSISQWGATTSFTYDIQGNLVLVRDAELRETSFLYDDRGNLLQRDAQDTGTTHFIYDDFGRLVSKTDQKGITIHYTHDSLGRVTKIDYPTDPDILYEYDLGTNGKGRLTKMTDAIGEHDYAYDADGNLTTKTVSIDGTPYTTHFSFSDAHRLTGIMHSSGRKIAYTRDETGSISAVSTFKRGVAIDLAANVSSRPFGAMQSLAYGNGLTLDRSFDEASRITSILSGMVQNYGISYFANDNVEQIADNLDVNRTQSFIYDGLDRLQTANGQYGSISISFDHDLTGNRTNKINGSDNDTYDYEPVTSKLVAIIGTNPASFTYDANGNIATKSPNLTFIYNEANRMTQALAGTTPLGDYVYNGQNQRMKKTINGETTLYFYDLFGNLAEERKVGDSSSINYIHLDGLLLARIEKVDRGVCNSDINWDGIIDFGDLSDFTDDFGTADCINNDCLGDLDNDLDVDGLDILNLAKDLGKVDCDIPPEQLYYFHTDHLGTPHLMTDETGTVVWKAVYDPFGKAVVDPASTVTNNFRFPGQYFDSETGLNYNWHRYYDPASGRYMTPDPIGMSGGINLYAYVHNDPINFIDPWGLDETKWFGDGRSILDGPRNGNWGGKNWSGGHNPSRYASHAGVLPPTDSGDAFYWDHDQCYRRCDLKYNFPSNTCTENQQLDECIKSCDQSLVHDLQSLPTDPRNWESPPRPGTEADTAKFRDMAISYFN